MDDEIVHTSGNRREKCNFKVPGSNPGRGAMKNNNFSYVLKELAQQTPEQKLRIAFNLWQFVNDLSKLNNTDAKRKTNTSRAAA
jgi:hypothetical protein